MNNTIRPNQARPPAAFHQQPVSNAVAGVELTWTGHPVSTTRFRHHDGRVWTATIAPTTNEDLKRIGMAFELWLRSDGCRNVAIVVASQWNAQDATTGFMYMSLNDYMRLVADAKPTLSHPNNGTTGVMTFATLDTGVSPTSNNTRQTQFSRLSRMNGSMITIFPDADEVTQILENVLQNKSVNGLIIVDSKMNDPDQLVTTNTPAYRFASGRREVYQRSGYIRAAETYDATELSRIAQNLVANRDATLSQAERHNAPPQIRSQGNNAARRGRRIMIDNTETDAEGEDTYDTNHSR